jgi:hypothetical protein
MASSSIMAMEENLEWKRAYMAAILEKDRERISSLIDDAKLRLTARFHQLKGQGLVPCEEAEAMHDASYMLDALRSSLSYREDRPKELKRN